MQATGADEELGQTFLDRNRRKLDVTFKTGKNAAWTQKKNVFNAVAESSIH